MSFYIVKNEIDRFLNSPEPEVLAIKGDWGVGKTFSWNAILQNALDVDGIALGKYSYISLFGIDSLEDFKVQMFQQQIPRELIGTEANLETLKNNTAEILENLGKKSLPLFQGNHYAKSFTPALDSVSFLSLTNSLICIDDVERKGKSLAIKDILGTVSLLKEQKGCKVVLILNDSAFEDTEFKEEYDTYKEKVIDVELLLAPSSQECVEVALHPNSDMYEWLAQFIVALNINNIRVIKKIEKVAKLLIPALEEFETEVTEQAMHTLVLFSWCYYIKDKNIPSVDYVKSIGNKMVGADKIEYSDREKLWQSLLVEYGFHGADDFDLQVANTVMSGFVIKEDLVREAEKINRQVIASKSDMSYQDAWKLYNDSFDDNQEELIRGLYIATMNYAPYISPMDLNGCIHLFRDLEENEKADELIENYIKQRIADKQAFDLSPYVGAANVLDSVIAKRFAEVQGETHDTRSYRDVLMDISNNNKFVSDDLEILARANVDDFYTIFKEEKGEHLNSWVSICLKLGYMDGADERQRNITHMATQALLGIASESQLNARRVAKFGVVL
ncbi:hypothetical protein TDB9533_00488 [Thalassocella blandensis]|nr:hypothetical protein TDB9533_00488 [Thalassocella blandensis]